MVRKQELQKLYWELGRRIQYVVSKFHDHLHHGYDYEDQGLVYCANYYASRAIALYNAREKVFSRLKGAIIESDTEGLYLAVA